MPGYGAKTGAQARSPCYWMNIYHEPLAVQEEQEYQHKLREMGGKSYANFNGIH